MSNTTGNKIVDEISALHINSIPETWYHTIKRNNQPHAMAILILWDLVYWYKWTEVRDETSGLVIGYKKKFKADLLQRSYEAIGNKFGISKRQATDVIVFLEKMGAVKRVFRNIRVANTTLSNVLFIELVPSVIKELCNADLGEVSRNGVGGSHADSGEGLTDSGETYTTTSTNNTTTNTNNISEVDSDFPKLEDYLMPTNKKSTDVDLHTSKNCSSSKKSEQSFPEKDYSDCMSIYYKNREELSKTQNVTSTIYNVKVYKKRLRQFFLQYGVEDTKRGISNSIRHSWIKKTDYSLNVVLAPTMFDDYIAGSTGFSNCKSNYQKKRDGAIERSNMITADDDEYKLF